MPPTIGAYFAAAKRAKDATEHDVSQYENCTCSQNLLLVNFLR